eukprot:4704561-Heterocapsa_arctica.AAC.1
MSSLIAKAVAAAVKQHMTKAVVKKGVPPSQAQQFNIASDGGDGPADGDDDDDDDDEESEEEEDYEQDEEEDGREP